MIKTANYILLVFFHFQGAYVQGLLRYSPAYM